MNRSQAENAFQSSLETLLEDMDRELSPEAPGPYAGAGEQIV